METCPYAGNGRVAQGPKRASHPGTYAHGAPNKIWHETPLIGFCVLGDFDYNRCVSGDEWSRRRRLIRDCEPRRPTA